LDADKENYALYLQQIVSAHLLAPHGFLIVDNALLFTGALAPWPESLGGRAPAGVRALNEVIKNHPELDALLLPFRNPAKHAAAQSATHCPATLGMRMDDSSASVLSVCASSWSVHMLCCALPCCCAVPHSDAVVQATACGLCAGTISTAPNAASVVSVSGAWRWSASVAWALQQVRRMRSF
jgi:hypothetical protein